MTKKEKIKFLLEIRNKMKVCEDKCRWCSDGEGNLHNEGIHFINSFLKKLNKKIN